MALSLAIVAFLFPGGAMDITQEPQTTTAPAEKVGRMLAFMIPPDVARQVGQLPTGTDHTPTDGPMHITLAMLPDDVNMDTLNAALTDFASDCWPLSGTINGVGRFTGQDPNPLYLNFDSPDLPGFRDNLLDLLDAIGIEPDQTHGFTPHITLAHIPGSAPMPDVAANPTPVTFSKLTVGDGANYTDYPMSGTPYQDDDPAPDNAVMPEGNPTKAVPADAPDSDFAFAPKSGAKSDRKLYIGDFEHACLAAQAITQGLEGQKPKDIPPAKLPSVKAKIRAKLNGYKAASDDEKARKQKWLDALVGKKPAAKVEAEPIKALDTVIEIERPSMAVKALDDEGWNVGGYLVLWGDEQHKDLTGDWFTKATELGLDWEGAIRPILYHHGRGALGITSVGVIKSLMPDDWGVWAEGELRKAGQYAQHVKNLVTKGALKWSSGSAEHLREYRNQKLNRGEIVKWPIFEGSLTPTPAEPRGTDVSAMKTLWTAKSLSFAYKALNLPVDRLALPQEDEPESAQESAGLGNVAEPVKSQPESDTPVQSTTTQEDTEMELEMIAAIKTAVTEGVAEGVKIAAATVTPPVTPAPTKAALPAPSGIDIKPVISVGDDLRYAHMSSSDLAMMYMLCEGAGMGAEIQGARPFHRMARAIANDVRTDADHKMERRMSAKALREFNYSNAPGGAEFITSALPYKSLTDVEANNYRPGQILSYEDKPGGNWAIKTNELDTSVQSNAVSDWVNQLWSNQVILRRRVSNPLVGLMTNIEMPTNPFYLPVESTDPTVYYMVEGSDAAMLVLGAGNTASMSKVASAKLTLTAVKLGTRLGYSTEVQEDALPFTIPQFNRQMTRVLQNYIDDTIANGDTVTTASTNINLIDGTPSATAGQLPSYLATNGLRKYGLVTNTAQAYNGNNVAPTLAVFRGARFTLAAQYALDLANLAYIVDYKTYFKMLSMPEYLTYQNLGATGSAVTGLLPMGDPDQLGDTAMPVGMIDGIKVYVSAQIGLSQSGAVGAGGGKISTTGSNNVNGTAILIDKSRWFLGFRRGIEVQTFGVPYFSDTVQMVGMARMALTPFDTTSAVIVYNINVA